jgi:YegS C-terminal NAD kinase beta sandwich-like domain
MLAATSETAKTRIGWPAYVLGALRHLKDRPMRVSIRIDDGEPMRRRARSVLVANVGRLQGGIRLLAEAEPDDGVRDIAVLTPRTLWHWAALGWGVIRRKGGRVSSWRSFPAHAWRWSVTGRSPDNSTAISSTRGPVTRGTSAPGLMAVCATASGPPGPRTGRGRGRTAGSAAGGGATILPYLSACRRVRSTAATRFWHPTGRETPISALLVALRLTQKSLGDWAGGSTRRSAAEPGSA